MPAWLCSNRVAIVIVAGCLLLAWRLETMPDPGPTTPEDPCQILCVHSPDYDECRLECWADDEDMFDPQEEE